MNESNLDHDDDDDREPDRIVAVLPNERQEYRDCDQHHADSFEEASHDDVGDDDGTMTIIRGNARLPAALARRAGSCVWTMKFENKFAPMIIMNSAELVITALSIELTSSCFVNARPKKPSMMAPKAPIEAASVGL